MKFNESLHGIPMLLGDFLEPYENKDHIQIEATYWNDIRYILFSGDISLAEQG